MNNANSVVDEAPGAESVKVLSVEDVKGMLKRDLPTMVHLLDAIYKDQATLDMLASFLHGRYLNDRHRKELERQGKLAV